MELERLIQTPELDARMTALEQTSAARISFRATSCSTGSGALRESDAKFATRR